MSLITLAALALTGWFVSHVVKEEGRNTRLKLSELCNRNNPASQDIRHYLSREYRNKAPNALEAYTSPLSLYVTEVAVDGTTVSAKSYSILGGWADIYDTDNALIRKTGKVTVKFDLDKFLADGLPIAALETVGWVEVAA